MNDPKTKSSLNCENRLSDFARSKSLYQQRSNQGFTLLEVCIVIAIIATLSAIAVPNYLGYKNKAKIMVAITDIKMIEKQISLFVFENEGQLPNNLRQLTTLTSITDPWGNPYRYMRIDGGEKNALGKARKYLGQPPVNNDYDLYSTGKDGKTIQAFKAPVSRDDVVRAYEGRFVGLVSEL